MIVETHALKTATKSTLDALHWDTDLNAYREIDGKVMGSKCGLLLVNAEQGDVIYRLISASFIDEIAAQGRHTVTVDVIDETGRRLDGATVQHGWPWNSWPAADEIVQTTVFGAQLAEWGVFAGYNPQAVEYGPYWVKVDGVSDVFYGFGLPHKHHVCFTVVFQRMTIGGTGGGGGTVDPDLAAIKADTEAIRAVLDSVFR